VTLLIVSDSPALQSGLARVVSELVTRLVDVPDVDPHIAGWFHMIAPTLLHAPCPIYPAVKEPQDILAKTLEDVQPDVVLAIGDPWDFVWLAQQRAAGAAFKLVGYLNIESAPLPPSLEVVLDGFDVLTTSSEFGARVIDRPGVVAIHHGVDAHSFARVPVARIAGYPTATTFVVLLNGQNVVRKNFPVAIQGYAAFARGKTDTLLFANTEMNPSEESAPGFNLAEVVLQAGPTSSIVFETRNHGPLACVDEEHLRLLYSAATVLLVTSMGEGFGLPMLEAMAAGVVPIAPNGFSAPELLADDRGILIPVAATLRASRGGDFLVVSADAVAEALEQAYGEWKAGTLRARTEAGLDFALDRPWDRTAKYLLNQIREPVPHRLARGESISGHLRVQARAVSRRHPGATAVVKIGGLSDMLQTTAVVDALRRTSAGPIVLFTNSWPEAFEDLPGVVEHCLIRGMPQDIAVRSIADEFETCVDLRYISTIHRLGQERTPLPTDWALEAWPGSAYRLQSLGQHATALMLRSLGLDGPITPVFSPRTPGDPILSPAVAICTGAHHPLKLWAPAAWQELVSTLIADMITVVQIGGHEDPPVAGAYDLRGQALAATAWVLEQVDHLVTHDNAMAHLAASVGTSASVIGGPADPTMFRYPGHRWLHASLCPPCFWLEPTWSSQACAVGAPTCLNFPSLAEVLEDVRTALKELVA
jgi:glycosyltransferase involved in cell wall biosynthesis